jgi:DNA polymerase III epsilon subunit-like protein
MSTLNEFDHYMIDMETLGLDPRAKILSLGIVHFSPLAMTEAQSYLRGIYLEPDISAQVQRTADVSTVAWWESQDEKLIPRGTLEPEFVAFTAEEFLRHGTKPPMLWAQGTDFDIPKFESFISDYLADKFPWKYNSKRDLRTLISVCQHIEWPENAQKHNALADAQCQARMVWRCMNFLNGRGIQL